MACMHTNVRCFFREKEKRKKEKKKGGGGRGIMITVLAGGLMDVVGMGRYSCGGFFAYLSIL